MEYYSSTINLLYCKNSMTLLRLLQNNSGNQKTIICYGKNPIIDISKLKNRINVINIYRHGSEYCGMLNAYWVKKIK